MEGVRGGVSYSSPSKDKKLPMKKFTSLSIKVSIWRHCLDNLSHKVFTPASASYILARWSCIDGHCSFPNNWLFLVVCLYNFASTFLRKIVLLGAWDMGKLLVVLWKLILYIHNNLFLNFCFWILCAFICIEEQPETLGSLVWGEILILGGS